jgi:esterase/lipase
MKLTLCHGFNLAPHKMLALGQDLGAALKIASHNIQNIELTNHNPALPQKKIPWQQWPKDVFEQAAINSHHSPHYFIGYSLGGLAGLMAQHQFQFSFTKQIFIATPFYFRRPWNAIPRWIKFISSPDSRPYYEQQYQATSEMQWHNVRNVFQIQRAWHQIDLPHSPSTIAPTLLVNDPNDEIVDVSKVERWSKNKTIQFRSGPWNSMMLQTRPMHHVIVDPFSIGEHQWKDFIQSLANFLSA